MPCPVRLWAWWPRWLLKIIINNVYAFQYPTKNRCTILVQPSFAKLVLLPIREAYEWKRYCAHSLRGGRSGGLASNSWSVWMETFGCCLKEGGHPILLPIREAYEWKLFPSGLLGLLLHLLKNPMIGLASNSWSVWMETQRAGILNPKNENLASNSWSVWMETMQQWRNWNRWRSCFQFVKRMNGNLSETLDELDRVPETCFQFVKRMNGNFNQKTNISHVACDLLPIREAYEWKHFK